MPGGKGGGFPGNTGKGCDLDLKLLGTGGEASAELWGLSSRPRWLAFPQLSCLIFAYRAFCCCLTESGMTLPSIRIAAAHFLSSLSCSSCERYWSSAMSRMFFNARSCSASMRSLSIGLLRISSSSCAFAIASVLARSSSILFFKHSFHSTSGSRSSPSLACVPVVMPAVVPDDDEEYTPCLDADEVCGI